MTNAVVRKGVKKVGSEGGWPVLSLREAGISLIDCEHRTPPASESGFPYVAIPQVKDGRIDLNGARRITREHFEEWTRKANPRPYDIVLSRRCNPGETGNVPEDFEFALGQNLVLLRSDGTKVLKPFLRWLVRGPQWWDQVRMYINVGAIFDSLKCVDIPNFSLSIPPLPEQHTIAHILGTLDDKIELNRRMNETLEEMTRALFKSWFIYFDPVHAKAALKRHAANLAPLDWTVERARAYLDRMDPSIAALFPDHFVDSELGEIPAGWEVKPLPEAIDINPTRPLRKGEVAPYLDMANMPTKGHTPNTVVDRPFGSGTRFANGDTLVARITPCLENGKTAHVDFLEKDTVGWGSTEYIVMRSKPPLPDEFAYCLARSAGFREFAIQSMTGSSGRQRVPVSALSNYRLPLPGRGKVSKVFGKIVQPFFLLASRNAEKSRTLATLRDTLLPKLISGESRVGV